MAAGELGAIYSNIRWADSEPEREMGWTMRAWLKTGLRAGVAFSAVGIAFVGISLFTDVSRPVWVVLDNAKGAIGFAFCGLAGFLTGRRTLRATAAAAAGALGGALAGITVPVSMYVLAYGFLEMVRQYPFEYYDYLSSGASSVQAFLLSPGGHATVRGTSLGLVPVVVIWAATQQWDISAEALVNAGRARFQPPRPTSRCSRRAANTRPRPRRSILNTARG